MVNWSRVSQEFHGISMEEEEEERERGGWAGWWSSVFSIGDRTRTLQKRQPQELGRPRLCRRPYDRKSTIKAFWPDGHRLRKLLRSLVTNLSLSLPLFLFHSLFCPARVHVHCALFFPLRLSTGHTIRLLSRYRPIVRRVNGGMRDNCATLQNAFGAISIYSSIENIYTSNSFSRREVLDLCEYLFRIKFNECF